MPRYHFRETISIDGCVLYSRTVLRWSCRISRPLRRLHAAVELHALPASSIPSSRTSPIAYARSQRRTAWVFFCPHRAARAFTDAGRRLLPYAQRLSALSREALLAARDDGVPKGPLAIGAMETTAAVRLPPLLTHFHHRFPDVQLTLQTGPTAMLIQAVLDSSLD